MAKKTAEELREQAKRMLLRARMLEQQEYIRVGKIVTELLKKENCTIDEIRKALKR